MIYSINSGIVGQEVILEVIGMCTELSLRQDGLRSKWGSVPHFALMRLFQHQMTGSKCRSFEPEWRQSRSDQIGIDEIRAVCLMG